MGLSCPLGTTRRVPREKFLQKPKNKSFIDQAFSVQMAGYWPRYFLRVYGPRHAEEKFGKYPAILTSHLVNNPYISAEERMAELRG